MSKKDDGMDSDVVKGAQTILDACQAKGSDKISATISDQDEKNKKILIHVSFIGKGKDGSDKKISICVAKNKRDKTGKEVSAWRKKGHKAIDDFDCTIYPYEVEENSEGLADLISLGG